MAFVFKSQIEQHIGEITYFRVIRGKITEGTELVNTRTGNKEKLSQLFAVAGKNRIKVTELSAGDIGCTVKLKGTRTNGHPLGRHGSRDDRTHRLPRTPLPRRHQVQGAERRREARQTAQRRPV